MQSDTPFHHAARPVWAWLTAALLVCATVVAVVCLRTQPTPMQRLMAFANLHEQPCSDAGRSSARHVTCAAPLPSLMALEFRLLPLEASVYDPVTPWSEFTALSGFQEWRTEDGWHHLLVQTYKEVRLVDCIGHFGNAKDCHASGRRWTGAQGPSLALPAGRVRDFNAAHRDLIPVKP